MNRYSEGDIVICTNVTEENHEGLELGAYYRVVGATVVGGEPLFSVRNSGTGTLHHSIDRFYYVETDYADSLYGLLNEVIVTNDFAETEEENMIKGFIPKIIPSVYDVRELGRQFCQTEGSDHYKEDQDHIEPLEYAMANGMFEDFAIMNVVKYATRYKRSRNLKELVKIVDYAQLLCGQVLMENGEEIEVNAMSKKQRGYIAGLTKQLGLDRTNLPEKISPIPDYHELTEREASTVIDRLLAIKTFVKGGN